MIRRKKSKYSRIKINSVTVNKCLHTELLNQRSGFNITGIDGNENPTLHIESNFMELGTKKYIYIINGTFVHSNFIALA